MLENHPDPRAVGVHVPAALTDALPAEKNLSRIGLLKQVQTTQKRALSGAARPEHEHRLSAPYVRRHPVHRRVPAENLLQPANAEKRQ